MKAILGKLNDELLTNLMNKAMPFADSVQAAVAYAQPHPFFETCKKHGLRLTYYGLLDEESAVSTALLRDLLNQGPSKVECRLVKGHFHPKVIWWRGFGAYVGSANLTHAAWFHNVEAGVFLDEDDLQTTGFGEQLDAMFDHLAANSVPLTKELLSKLESLAADRKGLNETKARLKSRFDTLFGDLPGNPALTVVPAKGHRENKALKNFVREWMETLEKLRGLAVEFAKLGKRPKWVDAHAHPVVHFDQFLHAYYYSFVRGGDTDEDDEDDEEVDDSTSAKIESFFDGHRANPAAALREGATWWAGLDIAPNGEDVFIRASAPEMIRLFSRESIRNWTKESFREALRNVNAFRMRARQTKNSVVQLPEGSKRNHDERITLLANHVWENARTSNGRSPKEVFEFLIWGDTPQDMAQRLWLATHGEWALPYVKKSTLGEAVGWARPDEYPPRNNRTNKALRALGHNVKLFYKG